MPRNTLNLQSKQESHASARYQTFVVTLVELILIKNFATVECPNNIIINDAFEPAIFVLTCNREVSLSCRLKITGSRKVINLGTRKVVFYVDVPLYLFLWLL